MRKLRTVKIKTTSFNINTYIYSSFTGRCVDDIVTSKEDFETATLSHTQTLKYDLFLRVHHCTKYRSEKKNHTLQSSTNKTTTSKKVKTLKCYPGYTVLHVNIKLLHSCLIVCDKLS